MLKRVWRLKRHISNDNGVREDSFEAGSQEALGYSFAVFKMPSARRLQPLYKDMPGQNGRGQDARTASSWS